MNKKINIFIIILCLFIICACARTQETNKIISTAESTVQATVSQDVGADDLVVATCTDYPPFEFIANEKVVGADIRLAQFIAQSLNKRLVLTEMTFDEALIAVADSRVDMVAAALQENDERSADMAFSESYYTLGRQAVVIRTENKQQITGPEKLENALISCINGGQAHALLSRAIPEAKVLTTDNDDGAIEALLKGSVDAAAMGYISAKAYCYRYPEQLSITGIDIGSGVKEQLKLAINKKDSALVADVNNIIKLKLREGMYESWLEEAMKVWAGM